MNTDQHGLGESERIRIVLQRGYRTSRQQRKRLAFKLYFAEITKLYGGEPRKIRRAIAWTKARKFKPA